LIGFIGAPWTLVAYSVEGGHSKLCPNIKKMCLQDPAFAHSILEKYTEALCTYASYQVLPTLTFEIGLLVAHALGAGALS
jgi:uroporphyrinogen decarboxylase